MPSKTINTEMRMLVESGKLLSTGVKNIEIRPTENATALVMSQESARELAEKIIAFAHIIDNDKRIILTVLGDSNRVTITSY